MHPAPFDYVAATSVAHACQVLDEDGENTRVLAGGQSLLPRLIRRLERPHRLVDISRIAELRHVYTTTDALHVGAATTQSAGESFGALTDFGVLAQALPRVGKVTTRNRGTICGSLAHANPAAELGVCLLALGGEVTAVSSVGSRLIRAEDFFRAPHRTALRRDELLHTVAFRRPAAGVVGHFDEVTLRGAGDTPLVSAAVTAQVGAGEVTDVRIVVGGAGQVPVRAPDTLARELHGRLDDDTVSDVSHVFAAGLEFHGDAHGSAAHRQRLAEHIVARLLRRLRGEVP